MCPNNRGYSMPNFLMFCSKDYQSGHEATTLKLTLQAVFEIMGPVNPNAIVIDKSATKFYVVTTMINNDPWCWANNIIGSEQIKCKLLLCWFHVKNSWMEHLVSHVTVDKRTQLYCDMCGLLDCLTYVQFYSKYIEFKITWATEKLLLNNVATEWADNCRWRGMWPRFNHLYEHEFVNTTNFVERLWHFIKYTLLDKKVNQRLGQLIWALIVM